MNPAAEKSHAKLLAEHFNRLFTTAKPEGKQNLLRNMALYLFEMGEYRASLVFLKLGQSLLMELTKVMAGIPDYSKEDSQMVVTLLNKHLGFEWEHSGVDFLQIALEKGFGSEKANEILAEVSVSLSAEEKETLFDFLLEYPMPDVIFVLSGEPNRIAAIVLNHMDPSVAHDLLDHLEERRNDIKDAMDSLSEVDPHILIQTRKHIEEQVENSLFLLDHMQKTMN